MLGAENGGGSRWRRIKKFFSRKPSSKLNSNQASLSSRMFSCFRRSKSESTDSETSQEGAKSSSLFGRIKNYFKGSSSQSNSAVKVTQVAGETLMGDSKKNEPSASGDSLLEFTNDKRGS